MATVQCLVCREVFACGTVFARLLVQGPRPVTEAAGSLACTNGELALYGTHTCWHAEHRPCVKMVSCWHAVVSICAVQGTTLGTTSWRPIGGRCWR